MPLNWSFKRNFTGAKEIKDTNDYLSKVGRAIGTLDYMPVGFSMPWWSDTLPSSKYMFMEGQSLEGYPYAQAVFGDSLPDLRGMVLVHKSADTEFNAIKKTGGEKAHTLTVSEIPDMDIVAGGTKVSWNKTQTGTDIRVNIYSTAASYAENWGGGFEVWADGGGLPHNNLQPYIVCRYIAKVLP